MTTLRHAWFVALPAAFAVLLCFHPMIGDYEGLRDVTTRFQTVHLGMVLVLPLLAIALHQMLGGLRGRAATVGRLALIPFVAFYVPYVAFEGIALGVLGQQLNALPPEQRDAVATGLVQDFAGNAIVGEPGLFWALGSMAWIVVIVSAVLAFPWAGAPLSLQLLLGASALIGAHAPPLAPIGYVCFAAAIWMVLRARHATAAKPAAPPRHGPGIRHLNGSPMRRRARANVNCARAGSHERLRSVWGGASRNRISSPTVWWRCCGWRSGSSPWTSYWLRRPTRVLVR
jgi:hypothetical protein